MGRKAHIKSESPLISGGMFAHPLKRSKIRKEEPTSSEIIRDYGELLDNLNRALTEVVDHTFPTADFLHRTQVDGSNIEKDTKLSFVIRSFLGLSQMTLRHEFVANYKQTLIKHLESIQHNPAKRKEYTELLEIVKTYQSLAKAMNHQQQIRKELFRLDALDLASKTIDRRLRMEWVDPCIQEPIAELTRQIAKMMRCSEQLQSPELAGQNNSLASLLSLIIKSSKTRKPTIDHRISRRESATRTTTSAAAARTTIPAA